MSPSRTRQTVGTKIRPRLTRVMTGNKRGNQKLYVTKIGQVEYVVKGGTEDKKGTSKLVCTEKGCAWTGRLTYNGEFDQKDGNYNTDLRKMRIQTLMRSAPHTCALSSCITDCKTTKQDIDEGANKITKKIEEMRKRIRVCLGSSLPMTK